MLRLRIKSVEVQTAVDVVERNRQKTIEGARDYGCGSRFVENGWPRAAVGDGNRSACADDLRGKMRDVRVTDDPLKSPGA